MKKTLTFLVICIIVGLGYWFITNNQKGDSMNTLIPRSVIFGNPEKSMVRLSNDGKNLSYLANLDGVLNIFVAETGNPLKSHPITKDTGRGIRRYFWLYDGSIAYLKDAGGDENEQIHIVNIETKQDKIFTPEKVKAFIYAVSHKNPDEIIIGLNDRNQAYHDVYLLNVKTGEKTLIFLNELEFSDFIFDDDYNLRFASKSTTDGGNEYFKAVPTKESGKYEWISFIKVGHEDAYTTSLLGLTGDGKTLYMLDSRETDLNILKAINIEANEEKVLAKAEKAQISNIMSHPATGIVEAYSTNYLRKEWTCLDKEIEEHLINIKQTLKGELNVASRTLDDNLWIVADMRDDGPIGFYIYNKSDKKLNFLFSHRSDLDKYKLSKMEGIVIKARDGLHLPCYITKPVDAKGTVPLVLLVHGGPWHRDEWGYHPEVQWLANRGYAVLQVNYRSSTGFGKTFTNLGNLEWGRKMHEDLLDTVEWAIKEGIADSGKIAIYGGSYGGYAALWVATNSGDIFKCAVDIVGPSNLQTLLATFPAYWASFMEKFYKQVGDPRTEYGKALLKERSPLTHVDKIKIPVLIAHGEKDPRVKQAESEQIVAAMKAKNLSYIYMLFMDEGHGFVRPENKFGFYAVAEKFLAENLGGRFERMTDEIDKTTLIQEHKDYLKSKQE